MTPQRNSRHESMVAIILAGLLCLTFLASKAALNGPFLFDDFPNLANLSLLAGHPTSHSLGQLAAQYGVQPGRPLSMLSFAINDSAWPSDPWAFKYTNLLLHLLVGVMVFGFCRSLAAAQLPQHAADRAALLSAAAWLVHPMQLATSMLVVQRMTQLEALFALGGLWTYVALLRRGCAVGSIAGLAIGTVLATLCKETGTLVPLLALVANTTVLRSVLEAQCPRSRRIVHWCVAIAVGLLAVVIAWQWPEPSRFGFRGFSLGERLLTECRVLCDYVFRIFIPSLRGDGIYHDDFAVSRGLLDPISTLPAMLVVVGAIFGGYTVRRTYPFLSFSLLWFFAGHLLESSVFPLELYFEHRNYLPMVGLLLGASVGAVAGSYFRQRIGVSAAITWIVIAAWLTSVQAPIWGNAGQLATVWALEHPNSPRAIQQHALYLIDAGRPQDAAQGLLNAYSRGIRGSDYPLQATLVACRINDPALAAAASPLVIRSLKTGEYNNSILESLRKLRRAVQADACPRILTADEWMNMTAEVLRNPLYANSGAQAYLRIERSYLRRHQRDLGLTMQELELAWAKSPTPELARMISATLASAGLYDEAITWAWRSTQHAPGGVQGWLSQDDTQGRQLVAALERLRAMEALRHDPSGARPKPTDSQETK